MHQCSPPHSLMLCFNRYSQRFRYSFRTHIPLESHVGFFLNKTFPSNIYHIAYYRSYSEGNSDSVSEVPKKIEILPSDIFFNWIGPQFEKQKLNSSQEIKPPNSDQYFDSSAEKFFRLPNGRIVSELSFHDWSCKNCGKMFTRRLSECLKVGNDICSNCSKDVSQILPPSDTDKSIFSSWDKKECSLRACERILIWSLSGISPPPTAVLFPRIFKWNKKVLTDIYRNNNYATEQNEYQTTENSELETQAILAAVHQLLMAQVHDTEGQEHHRTSLCVLIQKFHQLIFRANTVLTHKGPISSGNMIDTEKCVNPLTTEGFKSELAINQHHEDSQIAPAVDQNFRLFSVEEIKKAVCGMSSIVICDFPTLSHEYPAIFSEEFPASRDIPSTDENSNIGKLSILTPIIDAQNDSKVLPEIESSNEIRSLPYQVKNEPFD